MQINKKLSLIFILVLSVILLQCQKNPTGPPGIKDLFPLAVGNYWQYEVKINTFPPFPTEIREEIIGKDQLSDGSSVFVKRKIFRDRDATFSDTTISYLKFEGNELREYSYSSCSYKILLKTTLEIGAEWIIDVCDCPHCPVMIAITDSVQAVENITVPAGNFNDCYRIVTCNCPDYTDTRWFAPYIGITQFTVERIWGSATYVLTGYRVR